MAATQYMQLGNSPASCRPSEPEMEQEQERRPPAWWNSALFDVDESEMLHRRESVMNICMVQVFLSFALVTNYRRSPVLLVLQPFFICAGALGYYGAKNCKSLFVAAHVLGSAGLAIVFLFFILAETLLKHQQGQAHANADLFFILINAPMDIFLLSTAGASIILYLSLRALRRQLEQRREQVRAQFEALSRGEGVPGGLGGAPAGFVGVELSEPGAAAEERRRYSLHKDLRCPITLEVMKDPVIAGDGHSYEREAIERWLVGHRTSPLTGRVIQNSQLIPNHRLRVLIQDLQASAEESPSSRDPALRGGARAASSSAAPADEP